VGLEENQYSNIKYQRTGTWQNTEWSDKILNFKKFFKKVLTSYKTAFTFYKIYLTNLVINLISYPPEYEHEPYNLRLSRKPLSLSKIFLSENNRSAKQNPSACSFADSKTLMNLKKSNKLKLLSEKILWNWIYLWKDYQTFVKVPSTEQKKLIYW